MKRYVLIEIDENLVGIDINKGIVKGGTFFHSIFLKFRSKKTER